MTDLLDTAHISLLETLLPDSGECYLVGGALRDWLLERPVSDFDFITPGDPTELAQCFAAAAGGSWFPLDAERRQSRVVANREGKRFTYDFAPFRGPDLAADLHGRDFTINTLAMPLRAGRDQPLVDPLGGRWDIERRQLRACAPQAFADDPLRILRGVRHAVQLGFLLEETTLLLMREAVPLLQRVAPERIRAELAAIFAASPMAAALQLLRDLDLLPTLFGPAADEQGFALGEELVAAMEGVLQALDHAELEPLGSRDAPEDGFSRAARLKLAVFLRAYTDHDLESTLVGRLRLSRRNATVVSSLVQLPGSLARQYPQLPAGRGRALWSAALGPSPVDSLLLLAAIDQELRQTPALLLPAVADLEAHSSDGRIPDLVNGEWLQQQLGLSGPQIGQALEALRQEEIAGRIADRTAAETFLRRLPGHGAGGK
jgi:poly(A) polymerase